MPQPTRSDSTATGSSVGEAGEVSRENTADAQSSSAPPSIATAATVDLTRERTLIEESNAARRASNYATARAKVAEAVASLFARPTTEQDAAWLALLDSAGQSAWQAQDAHTANTVWQRVYDVRLRALPDDHPEVQTARQNLGSTLHSLGDLAGARALFETVLEVASRTLPGDNAELQNARGNLAVALASLGDRAGARDLEEKVLEVRTRTLPDDHPLLQVARLNLGSSLHSLGDVSGARALFEKVLEVRLRTLPDDHPDVQAVRQNLGVILYSLGDLAGARALAEKVLEVRSRTLPDDHPDLQTARQNLSVTVHSLGDLASSRALEEQVLEVRSRTLPDDHPDLQAARLNLAATIMALGDLAGARALEEKVLEVNSRTLPDDHPDLQLARGNLALTINALGDLQGAMALEEKVLEVRSRTLPDEHPDTQRARLSLASTIMALGDLAGARALQEEVLEINSRTLPDGHPDLQTARQNLAGTLYALGDLARAQALFETVLEVRSHTLPDDHPDLQRARANLAVTIAKQFVRAGRPSGESERERCAALIGALCRAQVRAVREAILGSTGRESEERCSSLAKRLDTSISLASGDGVFGRLRALEVESFLLSETTRGAAIVSAELTRRAAGVPKYAELRDALRHASDELVGLTRTGTTSEDFDRARTQRESLERELVALARELPGGRESGVELDVESLAVRLEEREAAVSFRRFDEWRADVVGELDSTGQPAVRETFVDSLCAFVVRSTKAGATRDASSALTLVDLGPVAEIEDALRAWRDGLGVGSDSRGVAASARAAPMSDVRTSGTALREKIFDPLLPALVGAERLVVALDDLLHLVPLDALPIDENALVGDRWRIETRATLTELSRTPEPLEGSGQLVAFGDVEYGAGQISDEVGSARHTAVADVEMLAAGAEPRRAEDAGILRGGAWSEGFSTLPGTGVEVRGIERWFRDQFGVDPPPEIRDHASATREQLLALAPKARWLHIATHGWFAPDSIRSWSDPEPLDKYMGLATRMSGVEQVKKMSPMLLCGLALAGADLPATATGRVPGLVTADELSTLDLTNCELVVLSACDTNVGERRAGQGVASLQKALQMAGARSVITSLWKVPDEATKDLMLDFYRRLWVDKKPKWQALWEAKKMMREAKDESGALKYTTRDWAAWVLTGDPN